MPLAFPTSNGMKPQNIAEGALPLLSIVLVLGIAILSLQAAFITALVLFVLLSAYLFFRRDWS